jgi:phage baseplate assembly protein W|tara:strand:- start:3213 stop:3620 length:408 start_codon:yes stop_codon:yes gene_type:complete
MAVPYQTKQFKDISLSFKKHPVTKDILVLKDNDAIKKSVINIIRTSIGDRFYQSALGTRVGDLLFSLNTDDYNQSLLKREMSTALQNWEPRVKVERIDTSFANDSNSVGSVEVIVNYEIIGQPNIPQEIQFVLEN